jgi:hypothetical protein
MRNRIDISTVKFRVAGVGPRQVSRNDKTQKTTPASDGRRPIWTVRLTAIDTELNTRDALRRLSDWLDQADEASS